jgi:hypothetical protein
MYIKKKEKLCTKSSRGIPQVFKYKPNKMEIQWK